MVVIDNFLDFHNAAHKDQPMPSSKRELTILWREPRKEAKFPSDLVKLIGRFNGNLEDLHVEFQQERFSNLGFNSSLSTAISACQNLQYLYLTLEKPPLIPWFSAIDPNAFRQTFANLTKLE